MARFKNEARAAGRLHHPNIVGVYEYGEDDAVTYHRDGVRRRRRAARLRPVGRPLSTSAQLVELMTQLLNALEFAHERGVVHRDIKPSNLHRHRLPAC